MINLYAGDPRSGKTHSVIEFLIIPALKDGRTVVTNIPLQPGEEREYKLLDEYPAGDIIYFDSKDPLDDNNQLDHNYFMDHERFPLGALFAIDEAWRYWPSGTRTDKIPVIGKEFFTEHGHEVGEDGYSKFIALITQDATQLASFVTTLVDYTYYTTKQDMFGRGKHADGTAYFETFKGVFKKDQRGKKPVTWDRFKYREEVWKYYISHSKGNGLVGNETTSDRRADFGQVLKKRGCLALIIMPLGIIFLIYSVMNFMGATSGEEPGADTKIDNSIDPLDPNTEQQRKQKKERKKFKLPSTDPVYIVGYVSYKNISNYFLSDGANTFTTSALIRMGYRVHPRNDCHVVLVDQEQNKIDAYCATNKEVQEDA